MLCLLFGSFAKQQQIYDAAYTLPAHFPTISRGAFEWIFRFKCSNLQVGPPCYQKLWDQFVDLSGDPTRSRTPVMSRRNKSKDCFLMKIHPPVMSTWNSSKLQRPNRWLNVRSIAQIIQHFSPSKEMKANWTYCVRVSLCLRFNVFPTWASKFAILFWNNPSINRENLSACIIPE